VPPFDPSTAAPHALRSLLFRKGRRATLAALAALLLPACKQPGASGSATRVISLSPSTTEAVYAIGAGPLLVGRSKHCDYPPEAQALPVVGGYADPSLEAIIALNPTAVVGARGPAGPALEQALTTRGLTTFFPETESIAQIEAMLGELGRLLHAEAGAASAIARLRAKKDAITAAVAPLPRVRVALLFDVAPIVAAGPGGFPDELIRLAGGENVIAQGGPFPTLNIEHLLALNPHVLLDGMSDTGMPGGSGPGIPRDGPGFRELSAVREGRVRALATSTALRPGPRIGDGLASIARAIHGDALKVPL
jgi:iron complex transport system substrate-binding protein